MIRPRRTANANGWCGLLLEDVTLIRGEHITLHLRFKGGAQRTIQLPLPLRSWEQRQTSKEAVAEIDRLLDLHTYPEIAAKLNQSGMNSGEGNPFTARIVARIQRRYGLKPRYDRLRDAGLLDVEEMAQVLHLQPPESRSGMRHGLIRGHAYNGKNDMLIRASRREPTQEGARASGTVETIAANPGRYRCVPGGAV